MVAGTGAGPGGELLERSWELLAEGDDGPLIPSMAAAAVIRHCLAGKPPMPGARPATADLELADYDALFARRRISTGFRQASRDDDRLPLYRRMLGEAWALLPEPVRAMHSLDGALIAQGTASVERGRGPVAWLAARLFGFPPTEHDIPVKVVFRAEGTREHWHRTFGTHSFSSTQEQGRGRFEWLVCERFGPLCFGLALVHDGERLRLVLRRWSFFGLPMPLALGPRSDAYEFVENGRFCFHVEIGHRLTGLIVRYHGWLEPHA